MVTRAATFQWRAMALVKSSAGVRIGAAGTGGGAVVTGGEASMACWRPVFLFNPQSVHCNVRTDVGRASARLPEGDGLKPVLRSYRRAVARRLALRVTVETALLIDETLPAA